jgi:HD superfamily phosphohydrolase
MAEKIIRDPVHDVIAFRLDRPADALLFQLVGSVEFQRLRRIRQLGMASLAYPGADHSRYSHSLGVMETTRRMLAQLKRDFAISEEDEKTCVVAALLHDLGHGPFSHVFERVTGIHHERLSHRVILDAHSEVHRILIKHDKLLPERIVDLLSGKTKTVFADLLSSQLDADRLDYLLRDNLMTGAQYGSYDLNWLIYSLTIDETHNRLAVTSKGISAVEAYLTARFHMYRNVYFHKVVRSAEGMVKLALQRARRLAAQDRLDWPRAEDGVHKALLGRRLSMREFVDLDDVSVLHCFKLWTDASDPVLASLCRGLLYRKLYKTIDLSRCEDIDCVQKIVTAAEDVVRSGGGEPAYDLFYDEIANTPYEKYDPASKDGKNEILVREPTGEFKEFATISPIVEALNRQLMFRRLHVSESWKAKVMKAIEGML